MTWEFSDVASGSAPGWHGLKITGSAETFAPDFPKLLNFGSLLTFPPAPIPRAMLISALAM